MISLWTAWLARLQEVSRGPDQRDRLHPRKSRRRARSQGAWGASESLEERLLLSAVTVDEGAIAQYSGAFEGVVAEDVNGTSLSATVGTVSWDSSAGVFHWSLATINGPAESQTVFILGLDQAGNPLESQFDLTVNNVAPVMTASRTSVVVFDLSEAVHVSGTWFDPGDYGDGASLFVSEGDVELHSDGTWDWTYDPLAVSDYNARPIEFTIVDADGGTTSLVLGLFFEVDNHAPVLDNSASVTLNSIAEDATDNAGTLISDLVAGLLQDEDNDAPLGVAITSTNTNFGTWQYRLQESDAWQEVGDVSEQSALLLPSEGEARIRFVPVANYHGAFEALTFRGWDGSDLLPAGSKGDTSRNGGAYSYSLQPGKAVLTVTAVEESPIPVTDDFFVIDDPVWVGGVYGQVATAADGSFAVLYYVEVGGAGYRHEVQRFSAEGVRIGDPITVLNSSGSQGFQVTRLGMREDGSFVVAWIVDQSSESGVYFQRYGADGVASGDVVRVTPEDPERSSTGQLLIDMKSDGRFALVWSTVLRNAEVTNSIFACVFSANGTPAGEVITVASITTVNQMTNSSIFPGDVSLSRTGSLAVTWTERTYLPNETPHWESRLLSKTFDANGSVISTFAVTEERASDSYTYQNKIQWDAEENVWVLWNDRASPSGFGGIVRLQKFNSEGDALNTAITLANVQYYYDGADFAIGMDGELVVTWFAPPATPTGRTLLLLQRLHSDGSLWGGAIPVEQQNGYPPHISSSVPTIAVTGDRIVMAWTGRIASPLYDAPAPHARVFEMGDAAPILGKNDRLVMPRIHKGDQFNSGVLLEDLLAGHVVDDAGVPTGLAIVDADDTQGTWQYSSDQGASWRDISFLTNTSALILAADGQTRIRFSPNADYEGTVAAGLTVRAWNQRGGWLTGAYVDTTKNGGYTPFSQFAIPVQIKVQGSPLLPPVQLGTESSVSEGAPYTEKQPLVKMWSDGTFAAFWFQLSSGSTALAWQRYNADGSKNGGVGESVLQVNGVLQELDLSVADDKSVVMVWSVFDPNIGSYGNSVLFQYFVPSLTLGWTAGIVQTLGGQYSDYQSSRLQVEHNSASYFTYSSVVQDRFTGRDSLYVWKSVWNDSAPVISFPAQDTVEFPGGGWGILNREILHTDVALLKDGSVVVAYELRTYGAGNHSPDSQQVWIRRYSADRTPLGDVVLVDATPGRVQRDPVLEPTPDGGFVIAWTGLGAMQEDYGGFVQKFSAAGSGGDVVQIPTSYVPGHVRDIHPTSVAVAPDGTFYVVGDGQYFDGAMSSDVSILLQAFNATGQSYGPLARVNVPDGDDFRARPAVGASGYGTLFVSWFSQGWFPYTPTALRGQLYSYLRTAPVIHPADELLMSPVNQGDPSNEGTLVRDLVPEWIVTDSDPGALKGIAITGVNPAAGAFQFSRDGGVMWELPFDDHFSDSYALLLAADDLTRIRFIPPVMFSGTIKNALTFRAWDQTDDVRSGSTADVSLNGFDMAYSENVQGADSVVASVISLPLEFYLSSSSVLENSPGAVVGELTTNDTNETNSYIFEIMAGGDGSQFTISGNQLKVGGAGLDYESGGTRSVTIRSYDPYGRPVDRTFTISVIDGNDAPVLNSLPGVLSLGTLAAGAAPGNGILLRDFVGAFGADFITDQDTGALAGIAVTRVDQTNGVWQYHLNTSGGWQDFGTPTASSARLLAADSNTRIRFVPAVQFAGTASFVFVAWDQTAGVNGGTLSATNRGGSSAFSLGYRSATVLVERVNHAPVLNAMGNPTLTPIAGDISDASNGGTSITDLIASLTSTGGSLGDPDAGALQGIAVSSVDSSHGTWQFTIDGGAHWADFGIPNGSAARLLAADPETKIRFRPQAGFVGTANFLFVAWDQSAGVNGGTAAITSRGGNKPYSLVSDTGSVRVYNANHAPILDAAGKPALTAIPKNISDATNMGTAVSELIASLTSTGGSLTDADSGAVQGIAVTVLDEAHGTWQFTLNNGTTWTDFGLTSASNARLLAGMAGTRIRFRPLLDYVGNATFVFVAWDQTAGVNGGTASVLKRGGTEAFSLGYDTASINVFFTNTAPVLNPAGNPTLTTISRNIADASNTGTLVSQIIANLTATGGSITDADPSALSGIAITSADQSNGTWQYSVDGGTVWLNLDTPSASAARLLASDGVTRLRFKPNVNFSGTATFLFVAWDQSQGVNGGTLVATNRGASKPFSVNTDTASIRIQ